MNVHKVIQRRLRHRSEGVDVAGAVNAAIALNVNEPGSTHTYVSSQQRVVQRAGRRKPEHDAGGERAPER